MEVIATVETHDVPLAMEVTTCYANGSVGVRERPIQRERLLEVYVNDILTMQLGCSEGSLVELVVGRLFTEGLVADVDEIDCLSICEQPLQATVYLHDRSVDLSREDVQAVPTSCTQNKVLVRREGFPQPLQPLEPFAWEPGWIFDVARAFEDDTPSHRVTRGTHSCRIANETGVLFCCEDIGRHNAFDKAIGMALLNDVDLTRCLTFTSGRVPTDMAAKALRARIPVFASKTGATNKAIDLARRYGMTLLSGVSSRSLDILSDGRPKP